MTNASTCSLVSSARTIGSEQSVAVNGSSTSLSASSIVIVGRPVAGSVVASMYPMTAFVRSVSVSENAQIVTLEGGLGAG